MTRLVWTAAAAAVLAVCGVAGCSRSDDGTPVRSESSTSTSAGSSAPAHTTAGTSPKPSSGSTDTPESAQPGVLETTREAVPPNALACFREVSGQTAVATVADPAAPRITISVPPGWSVSPGSGDVGVLLAGPDDMVAQVTIAATSMDPAAAFTRYADDVMARYPISTLSLLPGDFCGYSGQRLMGTWAQDPDQSLQYQDRIAHIWTNTKDYLVAVHVEAPSGTPGFDAAADVLTGEFSIVLP
ncbi:hypothetical protein ACXDF8_26045 [Mycolicibacterium sp. CBM1]